MQLIRVIYVRLAQLIVLLFAISTVLFVMLHLAGDPAATLAGEVTDEAVLEEIREAYGLDRPVWMQYGLFISQTFTFDFGESYVTRQSALVHVIDAAPWTLLLTALAIAVNLAIAIPAGLYLAYKRESLDGRFGGFLVFLLQGVPGYVVGLVAIQIFSVKLGLLPSLGSASAASWVLPVLTMVAFVTPRLTRVVAVGATQALKSDYVRTAHAIGTSGRGALWIDVLPNAVLGAAALVGTQFASLLSGAVITEKLFSWPGMGQLLIESILRLDFPVVQACVVVIAIMVFVVNAGVDLLLTILDPRQRRRRRPVRKESAIP